MQQISLSFNLQKFEIKKSPMSERADLVGQITDLLNVERVGTKYKKLQYSFVGIKLSESKATISDMYWLLKRMKESKSAGKVFFGSLKTK